MREITPFLWFDTQAEEAMNFYVDTFNGAPYKKQKSRIVDITRYEKGMDAPGADVLEGKVLTGIFELAGQRFMALDGGPIFTFNEATSFCVECEDQKEVDYFWNKLSAVPQSEQCGWLKDKYGLSWQIVPKQSELMYTGSVKAKSSQRHAPDAQDRCCGFPEGEDGSRFR
jgi:predicted 3-demethylubiquinone-9 3-methyltransferase (glyoxalase superfamily)